MCPRDERIEAWQRLVRDLPLDKLDRMTENVPLTALPGLAPKILGGEIRGRIVVDVTG
jgi:acrylyl-CoA reductase (NADPH)